MQRKRACNNPAPYNGGLSCVGSETETSVCDTDPCDKKDCYKPWTPWSECSVSCGFGYKVRVRAPSKQCSNLNPVYAYDGCWTGPCTPGR